ncbi:MAG: phosphoribosylglycinamide formyltransferase [Phycisphaerales bacterium]|jgi:phosphoribosylglycinamide formyltransferase-1|nr:phosphoribosylglycinamide formyltransferase [Phycisphaerales bacterium]
MTSPVRLACLASGGGRTILNLVDHIEAGKLHAHIASVILSRQGLPAASRCRERGLLTTEPPADVQLDGWVLEQLSAVKPDLICLCGYLRLLPIEPWMANRVINIHPALLPRHGGKGMYGKHVHRAVLSAGDTSSGCTVHLVDERYDHGPTILQRTCPVHPEDDEHTLAARVFQEECAALPEAIQRIASGQIQLHDLAGTQRPAPEVTSD